MFLPLSLDPDFTIVGCYERGFKEGSPLGLAADGRSVQPVRGQWNVASLRPPRAHDALRRRAVASGARRSLRTGGLRCARNHGPLGADRRPVDRSPARDPELRAELPAPW